MDPSAPTPTRDAARPDRGLRFILLVGFGGLLGLLLYSGFNALNTLRDLHAAEDAARTRLLDRGRVLSTVILSTNSYSDHMEEFLLSVGPGDQSHVQESLTDAGFVAIDQTVICGIDATHAGDEYKIAGAHADAPSSGRRNRTLGRENANARPQTHPSAIPRAVAQRGRD